ncbi:MAG: hypothetical protein IT449_15310 [Phycisphaerales bacterium]|nr:hypothetical protein [Phycisphaerales bacterium]
MPDEDPIVEEVRRSREAWAERFQFNLQAIAKDAERRQLEQNRPLIRRPARPVPSLPAVTFGDAETLEAARTAVST